MTDLIVSASDQSGRARAFRARRSGADCAGAPCRYNSVVGKVRDADTPVARASLHVTLDDKGIASDLGGLLSQQLVGVLRAPAPVARLVESPYLDEMPVAAVGGEAGRDQLNFDQLNLVQGRSRRTPSR